MINWTTYAGPALAHTLTGLLFAVSAVTSALAQSPATHDIYTCVDARGRKLTSDRPIADCNDREQKLLNPSGTLKAKVGPALTAQEQADLALKDKAEQEERTRIKEEKRRDRALLTRYPNKAVHDKERAEALAQIGVVRRAAVIRVEELQRQRTAMHQEMEFYKKDPSKAPPAVRRQVDEVAHSLEIQSRFIAEQDAELQRVNARFDEELARLKQLWTMHSPPPSAAASKSR